MTATDSLWICMSYSFYQCHCAPGRWGPLQPYLETFLSYTSQNKNVSFHLCNKGPLASVLMSFWTEGRGMGRDSQQWEMLCHPCSSPLPTTLITWAEMIKQKAEPTVWRAVWRPSMRRGKSWAHDEVEKERSRHCFRGSQWGPTW